MGCQLAVVGMLWSGLLLLLRFGGRLEGPAPRICHRRALVDKAEKKDPGG